MNISVPLALFSWVPLTVFLFFVLRPHVAVLVAVIGGWLLLPAMGYNLPGLPPFSKSTAIAVGLFLGGRFSGQRRMATFHWKLYDVPMVVWCLSPLVTSMVNKLGFYDGLSGVYAHVMAWGIPFMAGRIYFDSLDKLRDLCLALVLGGLLYLPLCLFEVRMSPQLSNMVYGFFPHSFVQHVRYGGYRPIVFMEHGLMVSLWMALTTIASFWLWRFGEVKNLKGIPMSLLFFGLTVTTLFCKSGNAWIALTIGLSSYFLYRYLHVLLPFRILALIFPCYIFLRVTGYMEASSIVSFVDRFFDAERSGSLGIRLVEEDLFIKKTMEHLVFGWGGFGRGWPVDPETGQLAIEMIDAMWLIVFNSFGLLGIVSLSVGMLSGPWMVLRSFRRQELGNLFAQTGPLLLTLVICVFMIDSLVNSMVNPVYICTSGALLGWSAAQSAAAGE